MLPFLRSRSRETWRHPPPPLAPYPRPSPTRTRRWATVPLGPNTAAAPRVLASCSAPARHPSIAECPSRSRTGRSRVNPSAVAGIFLHQLRDRLGELRHPAIEPLDFGGEAPRLHARRALRERHNLVPQLGK